ncbi:KTSC domain containing protein [uncultured Caudovirales phage]|uniref:KTSC domain containing protein n=1 Tax=uncultured Caudovirales phage TaxID=2100421 RepID=A0A6J5NH70_9CAUD|nr:KTSC domain containing protein [uncultured Caudovirales phage]CAB4158273.1 KTSC domain containing protein [uncultured Caudovirales phage]
MADNFRPTKKQLATARSRFDEVSEALAATNDFSSIIPRDVKESGVRMETAPTSNPERPRAKTLGYNPNTNTLYIVFRDNTWWEYRNVPVSMWVGIQNSSSTGKYLAKSGLNQWGDMGPADLSTMSEEAKTRMADNAAKADRIQLPTLDDTLFKPRG